MTQQSLSSLATVAEAAGFRLVALDTATSTNDEVLRRAEAGDRGPLWVVARQQTKGRGRHGRVWSSPPGNIYASLLLTDPCDPKRAPELGFVAGLALHDAVARIAGLTAPRLTLKWPNDLLLDSRKLAGILLEGHRLTPDKRFVVIIGIGLNVAAAPEATSYPTASLSAITGPVTLDATMHAVTGAMATRLAEWREESGFRHVRDAWLERASGIGERVVVRLPDREISGLLAGIDGSGRLVVEGEHGLEMIDAGDLFFPALLTSSGRGG